MVTTRRLRIVRWTARLYEQEARLISNNMTLLACATLRIELQLQRDTGGESREDQISNTKSERACHKAIRQHRLQC